MAHRTGTRIRLDLLEVVNQNRIKKTNLMTKINLNHKLINKYIDEMVEHGLFKLSKENNNIYVIITDKGNGFLDRAKEIAGSAIQSLLSNDIDIKTLGGDN